LRLVQANSSRDPILKIPNTKKGLEEWLRSGRAAAQQAQDPEFKPSTVKKKRKKKGKEIMATSTRNLINDMSQYIQKIQQIQGRISSKRSVLRPATIKLLKVRNKERV
jgi:hypothetical protein